jgi:hypothetical protein
VGHLDPDPAVVGRHLRYRAGGGLLGSMLAPRLELILGALAALVAGWGLRFKPSPEAVAWRRRAAEERRTARLLRR